MTVGSPREKGSLTHTRQNQLPPSYHVQYIVPLNSELCHCLQEK
jgi:hypothetical protein